MASLRPKIDGLEGMYMVGQDVATLDGLGLSSALMTSMTIVGYGFMDLILYDRNIVDDLMTLPRMNRDRAGPLWKKRRRINDDNKDFVASRIGYQRAGKTFGIVFDDTMANGNSCFTDCDRGQVILSTYMLVDLLCRNDRCVKFQKYQVQTCLRLFKSTSCCRTLRYFFAFRRFQILYRRCRNLE